MSLLQQGGWRFSENYLVTNQPCHFQPKDVTEYVAVFLSRPLAVQYTNTRQIRWVLPSCSLLIWSGEIKSTTVAFETLFVVITVLISGIIKDETLLNLGETEFIKSPEKEFGRKVYPKLNVREAFKKYLAHCQKQLNFINFFEESPHKNPMQSHQVS